MQYIVFVVIVIGICCVGANADCQAGWYRHKDHCYYFSTGSANWRSAKIICRNLGGYLARIDTRAENEYLKGVARTRNIGNIWVDLTDARSEGNWRYSTNGKRVKFTDWYSGQPNGGRSHNCGGLYKNFGFRWDDYTCRNGRYYICEKELGNSSFQSGDCARTKVLLDDLAACRRDCQC